MAPQAIEAGDQRRDVAEVAALGDLHRQSLRGVPGAGQGVFEPGGELGILQLYRRDVHRDVDAPLADRGEGVLGHALPDLVDDARLFGERDEVIRSDEAPLRVIPAAQHLRAHQTVRAEVVLRLEPRHHLATTDSALEGVGHLGGSRHGGFNLKLGLGRAGVRVRKLRVQDRSLRGSVLRLDAGASRRYVDGTGDAKTARGRHPFGYRPRAARND